MSEAFPLLSLEEKREDTATVSAQQSAKELLDKRCFADSCGRQQDGDVKIAGSIEALVFTT